MARRLEPVPIGGDCQIDEGFFRQARRFDAGILDVFQEKSTQHDGKSAVKTVVQSYWNRFLLFSGVPEVYIGKHRKLKYGHDRRLDLYDRTLGYRPEKHMVNEKECDGK